MSSQGSAKAPDLRCLEQQTIPGEPKVEVHSQAISIWQVWKQVVIGEILNILERRRYDKTQPR